MEDQNSEQKQSEPSPQIVDNPKSSIKETTGVISSSGSIFNKKSTLFLLAIIVIILVVGAGGYLLGTKKNAVVNNPPQTTAIVPSPTVTQQLVSINNVIIPFVRDSNIYLYENGAEKLIVSSKQKSSFDARYDNAYPFLSPNGKYLAYIQFTGNGGLDPQGILNIYNMDTKETKPTAYKTGYFQWNSFNQLEFKVESNVKDKSGEGIDPAASKVTFEVVDPNTLQELASETFNYDDINNAGIGGFPLYGDKKYIAFKNNSYYLINRQSNTEKLLFQKGEMYQFSGWSPDGTYAIFLGAKQNPYKAIWISVNTNDPNLSQTEIKYKDLAGGAGGDAPTGLKWYFNKGFVMYCMQAIFFVDGSEPMELTHTGGGGCHNEEGFVATSPNGEYAFVKFDNRFELHTKNGDKKTITETSPISKTRTSPKNLIWINNDYMIIYESTFASSVVGPSSSKPKIYVYSRVDNTIKPIIEDGYLSSFAVGVP